MRQATFSAVPSWRVTATRHPPVAIFELVASADEFDALNELEMAHSAHYDDVSLLLALPRSEWAFGPGSGHVMAPFAYRSPSRFSDGSFGIYYAGLDERTAIREVAYHRGLFLAATREPACVLEEQLLRARISGELTDIRGEQSTRPEWYAAATDRYAEPQALGASLWRSGAAGLAFSSVRNPGGDCVGLFRPRAVQGCRQLRPLRYLWDGVKIAAWT
jgi:hypothetical protein